MENETLQPTPKCTSLTDSNDSDILMTDDDYKTCLQVVSQAPILHTTNSRSIYFFSPKSFQRTVLLFLQSAQAVSHRSSIEKRKQEHFLGKASLIKKKNIDQVEDANQGRRLYSWMTTLANRLFAGTCSPSTLPTTYRFYMVLSVTPCWVVSASTSWVAKGSVIHNV